MIIGKYSIDNFVGDGRIVIEWLENGKNCRLIVSDPEVWLDRLVAEKTKSVHHCAELFRLAFTNPDAFIDRPEFDIVNLMKDEIPGMKHRGMELFEYYVKEFAAAYRQKYKSNVTDDQLRVLVSDIAHTF